MIAPTGSTSAGAAATSSEQAPILTALVATELARVDEPVALTSRPGDDGLFVVERPGRVLRLDESWEARLVLDVTEIVSSDYYENGLLGLAFDPNGSFAYVYYVATNGDTVLTEYTLDPVDGQFDAESARQILVVEQPAHGHNGGQLAFGPDDRLYVGVGDGENPGDPGRLAQRLSSRLGKILRIDPRPTDGSAFAAPSDNPFVDTPGADPTIWASGLRNPWQFSFDSATGDLWIADVGQNMFEEINHVQHSQDGAGRGANFGWSAFEGETSYNADVRVDDHVSPILTLDHASGVCAVVGGEVVRNAAADGLDGAYLFGDWCSGEILALDTTSPESAPVGPLATVPQLTALHVGPGGVLIAASNDGVLYRLDPT
jgi:glucose/arabinose dehydrogenase